MRVAVVGAGIVGVTCAYELAAAGHEVTVFERRNSVAAEASFANAGVIAPGYVTPWAAPGMPTKVLLQLFSRDAAVRFAGPGALREWRWLWSFLRACEPTTYTRGRSALQRLAHFSRARLATLTHSLGLEYEQASGYMVLLRSAADAERARAGLQLLAELGVTHELVSAERARALEPGLDAQQALAAAIHLPQDGVGNCRQFAQLLRAEAQQLGAQFRFDTPVQHIAAGAPLTVHTAAGEVAAYEHVVLCAGVQANALLEPLGLRLPLMPVHGYSLTATLRKEEAGQVYGPVSSVMDERFKVAITRLGQRVRVAGSAEIGGRLDDLRAAPLRTLYRVLHDWFPGAAQLRDAQQWKGARPMLPDGPPVLGASGVPGLWLNLGHGSSGWALSCGSAAALAALVAGQEAPLDLQGLEPSRVLRSTRA